MIKKIETIYIILGIAIIVLLAIAGFFIISLETAAPSNANKASSNSNKDNIQGAEDSKNNNLNSASAANVNQINDNLNTLELSAFARGYGGQ